jgi:hypothetical protein
MAMDPQSTAITDQFFPTRLAPTAVPSFLTNLGVPGGPAGLTLPPQASLTVPVPAPTPPARTTDSSITPTVNDVPLPPSRPAGFGVPVPLPPVRPAGLGVTPTPAPALQPGAQPVAHVAGPDFLKRFFLAGNPGPQGMTALLNRGVRDGGGGYR